VVDCLPSKCEVLSLKGKEKKKEKKEIQKVKRNGASVKLGREYLEVELNGRGKVKGKIKGVKMMEVLNLHV
jgi:hypothetical protein